MEQKTCTQCHISKTKNDFRHWRNVCKKCEREIAKLAQRKKALDPVHNKRRASMAAINRRANPERCLWWGAKMRAQRFGWAFSIDKSDIVVPDKCPVLGIPLIVGTKQTSNSPTLDRINNNYGYVKGNVCVISWRANSLKNDATLKELENIVLYMSKTVYTPKSSDSDTL